MTFNILTTSAFVIVLFGCGSSDASGLYSSDQPATSAGSGSGSGSAASAKQDAGDSSSDPPDCDEDEECTPLLCNKALHQCAAPGGPDSPCDRDKECASDECEEGYCE
jgi:hypothetical protein